MTDKYQVTIDSSQFEVKDLIQNKVIFNTNYTYVFFDPSGSIVFPSSPTISALGTNNLTFQINNSQFVVPNPLTGNSNPSVFDTYISYFRSLNETIISSSFTTVQSTNVEIPSLVAGGDPLGGTGTDLGGGG